MIKVCDVDHLPYALYGIWHQYSVENFDPDRQCLELLQLKLLEDRCSSIMNLSNYGQIPLKLQNYPFGVIYRLGTLDSNWHQCI